ncbi:MAG: hypothetical protein NWF14_07780, partial [Candidatus Bathyarchaeota archaeon]|nr:hypothetical protein [Candidatus Bathyarchaeota archaeon]
PAGLITQKSVVQINPPLPSLYSGTRFFENSPAQAEEYSKFENSQNLRLVKKERVPSKHLDIKHQS